MSLSVLDLSIVNRTKGKLPSLPFVSLKRAVLKKGYALELIFVSPSESRSLNRTYRKKNKPANVLSFGLSRTSGQIVLCPHQARLQAKEYGKSVQDFIGYLFIHGLLHLKGYRHGSTMEVEEKRLSEKFFSS